MVARRVCVHAPHGVGPQHVGAAPTTGDGCMGPSPLVSWGQHATQFTIELGAVGHGHQRVLAASFARAAAGAWEPVVENRYRYYVPTLGQYLTPDPMHQASVMAPGPQAYAYANGNPMKYEDPTGEVTLDRSSFDVFCSNCDVSFNAAKLLQRALEIAATSSCRRWWNNRFPGQQSLTGLLMSSRPNVLFGPLESISGGAAVGVVTFPGIICLDCKYGAGDAPVAGAHVLIHELVHWMQVKDGNMFDTGLNGTAAEADADGGAAGSASACKFSP
jgi:RHS repeat-associated protein